MDIPESKSGSLLCKFVSSWAENSRSAKGLEKYEAFSNANRREVNMESDTDRY